MPFDDDFRNIPKSLIVIGFGRTEMRSQSNELLQASISFCELDACQEIFGVFNLKLSSRQFCAIGEGNVDACKGDSGEIYMENL